MATRSTTTSDRLEDALTKLTTQKLYLTHTIQQLTHKIDVLIHHLPKSAPPSHSPSSFFAIPAFHGCLSLYSDHARPQHSPAHPFSPPSSSTITPSSSFAKALLAHAPMLTPPPLPPLPSSPPPSLPLSLEMTPSPMLTAPTTMPPLLARLPPPPPPPFEPIQSQPTTLSWPITLTGPVSIMVVSLLANSNLHVSSDHHRITIP
ncbi:hypothetical protein HKD37_20G055697 [Glycine soja]